MLVTFPACVCNTHANEGESHRDTENIVSFTVKFELICTIASRGIGTRGHGGPSAPQIFNKMGLAFSEFIICTYVMYVCTMLVKNN